MPTDAPRFADLTLSDFSERLASAEPTPGGGSAAAIAAALAASLVAMVARLSLDRPRYAAYEATHRRALDAGESARVAFLRLADDDAAAYARFSAARKMPRETEAERGARDAATVEAARAATEVPLAVVRECHRLIAEVEALAGRSNTNAASDLDVAALLANAAARSAGANVLINLPSVSDDGWAGGMTAELDGLLRDIDSGAARVHRIVNAGDLRDPEEPA